MSDAPVRAIALLAVGVVLLSLQDALIKMVSDSLSFWQFQTVRSVLNIVSLVLLACFMGGMKLLHLKRPRYVLARSLLLAATVVCLFAAAPRLSFSQMAAGLYTYPLFITALAFPILGERIGIWRLSALLVGAIGTVLLLNPFAAGFSLLQILPISAGLFYALNVMAVRRTCRGESPLAMGLVTAMVFLCSGLTGVGALSLFSMPVLWQETLPFLALPWQPMTLGLLGGIAVISLLNVIGNLCNVYAYQKAESSILAPLDFTYLIFAALWGRVLFAEHLNMQEYAGMGLIALAGIVITIREQYRQRMQYRQRIL